MSGAVWHFQRADGRWHPYSADDAALLEEAWSRGDEEVELQQGLYTVKVTERQQRRAGSSHRREVRRGTWHFQRTDGSFEPFDESVAQRLEEAFGAELAPCEVDVEGNRTVRMKEDGSFEQTRSGGKEPRMVLRRLAEWKSADFVGGDDPNAGALTASAPPTRPTLVQDMAGGYGEGYEAGKEAAKALATFLDADAEETIERGQEIAGERAEESVFDVPDEGGSLPPPSFGELPLYGKGEWFWSYSERRLVAMSAEASVALELACTRGVRRLRLTFDGQPAEVLLPERLLRKEGKFPVKLVRGSWLFMSSAGDMTPYPEHTSRRLEAAFVMGPVNGQPPDDKVEVGEGRVVCRLQGGGFVQVRAESHSRRLVTRGGAARKLDPGSLGPLVPALPEYRKPGEGGEGQGAGEEESGDSDGEDEGGGPRRFPGRGGAGQQGLDARSWLGLQRAVGADVSPSAEMGAGEKREWGKGSTEGWRAQLQVAREHNTEAAAAYQIALADHNTAIRAAMEAGTQEMVARLARVGEALPREIGVVGVPLMGAVGNVVGFTSVIGDWMVGMAGRAGAAAVTATNAATDKVLHGGQMALSGVQTVLSAAQAEFVLGVEGAAIMENMINIHEQEFRHVYADITFMQIARGCAAYTALQKIVRPPAVWGGVARRIKHGQEDRQQPAPNVETLQRWLRYMRLCSASYSTKHMIALAVCPAAWVNKSDEEVLCLKCGLRSEQILHVVWDTQGYAAPGFLIIADEERSEVQLVVSGSKDTSDWLTDLRCAQVTIPHTVGDPDEVVETHAGIWASAIKLEERCLHLIQQALEQRPGWSLVLLGHSLGAGTASLLGIRWRVSGRYPDLQVFAFGNPPTLSSMAAIARTRDYITTVQNSDDFVARWCMGTCIDIVHAGHALATAEGVAEQLIGIDLWGFEAMQKGGWGWGGAGGAGEGEEEFEAAAKRKNKAIFEALLQQQHADGTLPSFSQNKAGFKYEIEKSAAPDMEWCRGVMRACEERQNADKLYPPGQICWLVPIRKDDPTRKPVWADIGGGKCHIKRIQADNSLFKTMAINPGIISDHALYPYEKMIEQLLEASGHPARDPAMGGWVSFLEASPPSDPQAASR